MNLESFITFMKERVQNTAIAALGIEIAELELDRVVMTMPVGPKTHQPAGILHGGASVLLAETAASIASEINIDYRNYAAVGLEINANHIKSKIDGIVTAVATPLHKGRKTMVWEIKISDEAQKLICISRCTVAILDLQPGSAQT
ncbi:hotdog fold thioesterase [Paenibacillus aestuarii]|uniref:Hotdog fold thioesterase n=1 Tax=Paenibacillus aestuarii TaxID=516965 RepID=A0ABW0KGM7_9BACL